MQRLEVNGAVRPIYGSLGVKRLRTKRHMRFIHSYIKIVSVWDPTACFKKILSKDLFLRRA